jgi:hypothetical protein
LSRNTFYVRFALLVALLAAVSVFLGTDPWGPW